MSQNLSSAAVMIGALRVNYMAFPLSFVGLNLNLGGGIRATEEIKCLAQGHTIRQRVEFESLTLIMSLAL